MNYRKEIENDIWFAGQLEALRQMETPHEVDVCDAVMKQIAKKPLMVPVTINKKRKNLRLAGAASVIGIVAVAATLFSISNNKLQAATTAAYNTSLSDRCCDVYDYCNGYGDEESLENAAFYDNPITDFI